MASVWSGAAVAFDAVDEPSVVVVGGGGFYGRYLVDDLLRHADTSVLVVSPRAAASAWFRTVAGTGRVRDVPGDAPWGGVVAVGEILAGRLVRPGLVPLDTWMPAERLWPALTSRGVNLWRRETEGGNPCTPTPT